MAAAAAAAAATNTRSAQVQAFIFFLDKRVGIWRRQRDVICEKINSLS